MKTLFKKQLSVILTLLMVFSFAFSTGISYADQTLPDGTYNVPVSLMKATNINESSMAAGALAEMGELKVIEGQWHLTVEFKPMSFGLLTGRAYDIKYYEDDLESELHPVEVYTTYEHNGYDYPAKVGMPVNYNNEGVFIKMSVSGMPFSPKAFIKIDTSNIVLHTITASAGENGSIYPEGDTIVADGETVNYDIVPNSGYHIKDVLVDDVSVGAVAEYSFDSVTADHTISASFEQDMVYYTITASAGEHGTIAPDGETTVAEGGSQTYTITADTGYHIKDVLVDDVSVGAVDEYSFDNVTADHAISASFEQDTVYYTITASAGEHGTIAPDGATEVEVGTAQTYLITAEAGYHIKDVLVDGESVGAVEEYTFDSVTADHTISASFEQDTVYYTITASAGEHGTITPDGETTVAEGGNQTYTITAEAGYHIKDVLVDDVSVGAVAEYSFDDVAADHTISASFEQDTVYYTITASAGEHGTIAPEGATEVEAGTAQTYLITAEAGYHIKDVMVDGESVGAVEEYSFDNVTADHTISASFEQDMVYYTITASAGEHGTIAPDGETTVAEGGSQTYTITAEAGYHIKDVMVDGESVGAVAEYSFDDVAANHTISVTFEEDNTTEYYTLTASAGEYGTITPDGETTVAEGGSQTYTITAEAGYHIKDVLVDDVSVGAVAEYSFDDVAANHAISVTFEEDNTTEYYTLTASAGEYGTIAPDGATEVEAGTTQTYIITAEVGYHIKDVLVDGESVGAVEEYTFDSVTADHTISASFEQDTVYYTITASAGEHGTIAPEGATEVEAGTAQTYLITAEAGYHIKDVLVDDVSVGAVTEYSFDDVAANHTISVTFEEDNTTEYYTLTASAGEHGTIAPDGATEVEAGTTQTYIITAEVGYHIKDVVVDNASVGAVAEYSFDDVAADHTISASFEQDMVYYTITASAGEHGTIAPDGETTVAEGGSQTYTITAEAGYHIKDVLVDDVSVGAVDEYSFDNVTAGHAISASFEQDTVYYTISASAGEHGTITPDGETTVAEGGNQTYTITAEAGYHIKDVLVDDVSVGVVTEYSFDDVAANHTISVTFEEDNTTEYYTLTASAGEHGTIAPIGETTVAEGGSQTYTITAEVGYHIKDVVVDGTSVGVVTEYSFDDVAANHTISVTFEEDNTTEYYTLTASAGEHGTITPDGETTVGEGGSQTYTITAEAGYHIKDVVVDDVSVGVVAEYSFDNVTADHTISASFEQDTVYYTITASAGEYGTITPDGEKTLAEGSDQDYTITANNGYRVSDVLVDGVSIGAKNSYTFGNVDANHVIEAIFTTDNSQLVNRDDDDDDSTSISVTVNEQNSEADTDTDTAESVAEVEIDQNKIPLAQSEWRYQDVSPQREFYRAVENLSQKGLLKGTGNRLFTPYKAVDRATLVTLMYRITGQPAVQQMQTFNDVMLNQWYSNAIIWAKQNEVVKGYSEVEFAPFDVLTKEQIITILYRYQQQAGKNVVDNSVNLMDYPDYTKISPYARQAIAWAIANDMLTLDDFGRINPQEKITRAAMAMLLDKIVD